MNSRVSQFANILLNSRQPSRLPILFNKAVKRLRDGSGTLSLADNRRWLQDHCESLESLTHHIDAALWRESQEFSRSLQARAAATLKDVTCDLGGGGVYPLLYFLTRYCQPNCVVETGVGPGYSSAAFLAAMKMNGKGHLYSSDFPLVRLPRPERYIGILVDEELRHDWTLYVDGDALNLPRILSQVESIDIFHYDSDKTYSGRQYAMDAIAQKGRSSVIVMDDIQDNSFFHDHVAATANTHVVKFEGKYVGLAAWPGTPSNPRVHRRGDGGIPVE